MVNIQMMVDVTQEFDEYFKRKGKPNWNQGDRPIKPAYFRNRATGAYYEYWPAFCAADEKHSWREFAGSFQEAVAKLDNL